ncbi:unnamed protein product [Diamesa hyperborea]
MDTQKPKKKRKSSTEPRISKDIQSYFNNEEREFVLKQFPDKLLRKKVKTPENLYICDEVCAELIANYITKSDGKDKPIIEINPGLGMLSKHLLKKTKNDLMLYENNEFFNPELNKIIKEHPERNVTLRNADFLGLWKTVHQDRQDNGNRLFDLLYGTPKKEWEDDTNIKLFATVGSLTFVKHLINSIVFQNSLFSYGRSEMYLCFPPPLYLHLTCSNQAGYLLYRASSVLFQLFFEHEFITKIPRKFFLPWQNDYKLTPHLKLSKFNLIDPEFMYLVKVVPRKDLYSHCVPDQMQALWFFIKQHFISRKNRVIPTLERWIPGCGPRLIVNSKNVQQVKLLNPKIDLKSLPTYAEPCKTLSTQDFVQNINIWTEFGDLSPTQTLTLFDQFISWKEYKQSPFIACLENNLMKMESVPEEEITEEDDDVEIKTKNKKTVQSVKE